MDMHGHILWIKNNHITKHPTNLSICGVFHHISATLLIPQRIDGMQIGGFYRGQQAEHHAHQHGEGHGDGDGAAADGHGHKGHLGDHIGKDNAHDDS